MTQAADLKSNVVIVSTAEFSRTEAWELYSDVVMGGVSESCFKVNTSGAGVFSGRVSTENNGGFAGVRFATHVTGVRHKRIQIDLTGDSKAYQFRIKHKPSDTFAYVFSFTTSGRREVLSLDLDEFKARYRGKDMDMPPFIETSIGEIGFLIAAKINEEFRLQIHSISIQKE